jgi:Ca2+-binding RTX toxin-like protein
MRGGGADILVVAGAAGTILTGGAGHDTFAFPNVMGDDEITNFNDATDTLQFDAPAVASVSAAMAIAGQVRRSYSRAPRLVPTNCVGTPGCLEMSE